MIGERSSERPDMLVDGIGPTRTLNYDIAEIDGSNGVEYVYNSVTLRKGEWDYGKLVSAIISDKYDNDRFQSVVNNYLDNPRNPKCANELKELQHWRKHAKNIARGVFVDIEFEVDELSELYQELYAADNELLDEVERILCDKNNKSAMKRREIRQIIEQYNSRCDKHEAD